MENLKELKVGEMWKNEEVTRISDSENIFTTITYNKVSCRYEINFYDLKTHEPKFRKAL